MRRGYQKPRRDGGGFQWVFPWWRRTSRLRPMLLPVGLAVLGFIFLLGALRVKVGSPQFEMERTGSLVYLPSDGDGLAWAIRARESGPELSRYEPGAWSGFAELERQLTEVTSVRLPARAVKLLELPEAAPNRTVELAAKGVPMLPVRVTAAEAPPAPQAWRLVPALEPLSPLGGAAMPETLPELADQINPKMAEVEWRFLLRLGPAGDVDECLPLTQNADGAGLLETWLRKIKFDPKLAADGGWFAVGVRFTNQTENGTDTH